MITPEQIAKLPKWAQQHIELLERNAESARRDLADHLAQGNFSLEGRRGIRLPLERRLSLGDLQIIGHPNNVEISVDNTLVITPEANNRATLRNKHWTEL